MMNQSKKSCPNCYKDEIESISEADKSYGIGLIMEYDFIGGLENIICNYRCLSCGYTWYEESTK